VTFPGSSYQIGLSEENKNITKDRKVSQTLLQVLVLIYCVLQLYTK
jgi:hypothetical protein